MSFLFNIFNFSEEIKKNCFFEFSVELGVNGEARPTVYEKSPFQRTFESDTYFVSSKTSAFSASLVITRKLPMDNIHGSQTLADFTFIVKGKPFKVQKSILAASSTVMKQLFSVDLKNSDECKIDNIEPNIFRALMGFLFVSENLYNISYDLYAAAHDFELELLKKICLDEIQKKLSTGNALKAYNLAFTYDIEKLSADAWTIIKR